MTFGNPHDRFSRDYPLGEYVHMDIPNDFDPTKVSFSSGRDFACCVSRASLAHRTWFVHKDDYKEFLNILDSGIADRSYKNRNKENN